MKNLQKSFLATPAGRKLYLLKSVNKKSGDVIVVFKTNNWHSYDSRDLIGIATNYSEMMKIIYEKVKQEGCKLDEDQVNNIHNYYQTQGYAGEGEFDIEIITLNSLF